MQNQSPKEQIEQIISSLEAGLEGDLPLSLSQAEEIITALTPLIGESLSVPDIDNPGQTRTVKSAIDSDSLTGAGSETNLGNLLHALKAMHYASFAENKNNQELPDCIQNSYNPEDLNNLTALLKDKGLFQLNLNNDLGVPDTAGTSPEENYEMGARYWVTDLCHNIHLMKIYYPASVPVVLKTLAKFYKQSEETVYSLIRNPSVLKDLKEKNSEKVKLDGLPHIFIAVRDKKTQEIKLEADAEFNRWRQESHGNVLLSLITGFIEGLAEKKTCGLGAGEIRNDSVISTIVNLTLYFREISFAEAPSGGNWEEMPFPDGLTYDTAVVTCALKKLKELLYSSEYSSLKELRKNLFEKSDSIQGTQKLDYKILSEKSLSSMVESGEKRLFSDSGLIESLEREVDASQIFTVAIMEFDPDSLTSIKKGMQILQRVEKELVGAHGIRRYSGDSYLSQNYFIAVDNSGKLSLGYQELREEFGSKDCSTPELLKLRQEICGCKDDKVAQWFFDSVMSRAWGKLQLDLKKLETSDNEVEQLLISCHEKQIEYFNRSLLFITGENAVKANGAPCPAWSVPEAYMNVSTFNGKEAFIPGINTPLAWAQTELFRALEMMKLTI